jgi:exodeoxyribonuclease VII large subunit
VVRRPDDVEVGAGVHVRLAQGALDAQVTAVGA